MIAPADVLDGPRRVIAFVGLAPAPSADLERGRAVALASGAQTGRRLADLLGRPVHDVGCTVNVLSSSASLLHGSAAYARGRGIRARLVAEGVVWTVVLGMDAARLMGLRHGAAGADIWFNWYSDEGLYYAIAPHPSGLSRWWNDPANVARARAFFEEVVARGDRYGA